jgi:hypothetical protein
MRMIFASLMAVSSVIDGRYSSNNTLVWLDTLDLSAILSEIGFVDGV